MLGALMLGTRKLLEPKDQTRVLYTISHGWDEALVRHLIALSNAWMTVQFNLIRWIT